MPFDYIDTSGTDLFIIEDGGAPRRLKYCGISSITWEDEDKAVAILHGFLPRALWLKDFPDGVTLIVGYAESGLRDDLDDQEVVIRLADCRAGEKQLLAPVPLSPNKAALLSISVNVICKLTLEV